MTGKEFKERIKKKGYSVLSVTKLLNVSRPYLYELFEKDLVPQKFLDALDALPDNIAKSGLSGDQSSVALLSRFVDLLETMQDNVEREKAELYKVIQEQRSDKDVYKSLLKKHKIAS